MNAKYKITKLIKDYKAGDSKEECLLNMIECMNPIIEKYSKKAYFLGYDDMRQELSIAIIEAVLKIERYENEGQCIQFLVNAIKNRFYELYRKNIKRIKNENNQETEILESCHKVDKDYYVDIEFVIDLKQAIECNSETKKKIKYHILLENATDTEIANKLNISRQYVNRCKKEIFKNLIDY